jgi:hypothetical protein
MAVNGESIRRMRRPSMGRISRFKVVKQTRISVNTISSRVHTFVCLGVRKIGIVNWRNIAIALIMALRWALE